MIKLAFFDFDNTLYSHKAGCIPESTLDSLKKLKEKGIKIVLSSGRGPAELPDFLLDQMMLDYRICNVGQVILDGNKNKIVYETMDKDVITRASAYLKAQNPSQLTWKGMDYDYLYYKSPTTVRKFPGTFPFPIEENYEMNAHETNDILGGVVIELETDIKKVEALFPELSFIVNGRDNCFDIQNKGVNKTVGMKKLLDYLKISPEECIAFGDGDNDVEMLTFIPNSVCLGNGRDKAKAAAKFVTTDILEDGVLNGLKHFGVL